jgi:hypothetical protein
MRVAGELARMADLKHLLPCAARHHPETRRTGLADRIARRRASTESLRSNDSWGRWEESAHQADELVDELVAMLMTSLLRQEGLDAGVFDLAESLLGELTALAGVPPVALGQTQRLESINHTNASVQLRFPGARVWDLPFLAHEFGHYLRPRLPHLEPELADRRPLDDIATSVAAAGGDRAEAHTDELLADAVATVCGGPTYPLACLCLRVPGPPAAARASSTHPSWLDRVATMRAVLDALSTRTGHRRYRTMREDLIDPLAVTVCGALPPTPPPAAELADRTVRVLLEHRPGLVYGDADAAISAANSLARGASAATGTRVTALLDGAWRWRLEHLAADSDDADRVATLVTAHRTNGGRA